MSAAKEALILKILMPRIFHLLAKADKNFKRQNQTARSWFFFEIIPRGKNLFFCTHCSSVRPSCRSIPGCRCSGGVRECSGQSCTWTGRVCTCRRCSSVPPRPSRRDSLCLRRTAKPGGCSSCGPCTQTHEGCSASDEAWGSGIQCSSESRIGHTN